MVSMTDAQDLLRTAGSFAAIERLQRDASPLEIAARYQNLVNELYWKAHDLPAVISMGRAGILFCLAQPASAESETLRSIAKAIAFNVGSFTWPGWEEPGISPTAGEIAFGMDCARLNLRLAIELNKPAKALANAHWLIGAHALAAGDANSATQAFQLAHDVVDASERTAQLLNLGYRAVAELSAQPGDSDALQRLDAITAELRDRGDDDSKMFLTQIQTARRLFVRS
jgi:hypothetical protein